jgi:hypothetical protein
VQRGERERERARELARECESECARESASETCLIARRTSLIAGRSGSSSASVMPQATNLAIKDRRTIWGRQSLNFAASGASLSKRPDGIYGLGSLSFASCLFLCLSFYCSLLEFRRRGGPRNPAGTRCSDECHLPHRPAQTGLEPAAPAFRAPCIQGEGECS